jgi:hypothetical protein
LISYQTPGDIVIYFGLGSALGFVIGAIFAGSMILSQPAQRQRFATAIESLRQQQNG